MKLLKKIVHKVVKTKGMDLNFPNEMHTNGKIVKLVYYCDYFGVCPKSEIKCLKNFR